MIEEAAPAEGPAESARAEVAAQGVGYEGRQAARADLKEHAGAVLIEFFGQFTEAHRFQGKDAILSGPAGGIVGMVRTALVAGHERVIGFAEVLPKIRRTTARHLRS